MPRIVTNRDDIIDSRDVVRRIEELEEGDDERETLVALAEAGERCSPDWGHGEALVRESYFVDYAKCLAADLGYISDKAYWPLNCIDWDRAAEELKWDYSEIDFGGVTYLIRVS